MSDTRFVSTDRLDQYHKGAVVPLKQTAQAAASDAAAALLAAADAESAAASAVDATATLAELGLSVVNGVICQTYGT